MITKAIETNRSTLVALFIAIDVLLAFFLATYFPTQTGASTAWHYKIVFLVYAFYYAQVFMLLLQKQNWASTFFVAFFLLLTCSMLVGMADIFLIKAGYFVNASIYYVYFASICLTLMVSYQYSRLF